MKSSAKSNAVVFGAALAAVASIMAVQPSQSRAGTSTNTAGSVQQGQSDGGTGNPALNNPAVTISFAGQTALKNFFVSPAPTYLQPGTSIILHDGTNGAPVTYIANFNSSASVQLASGNFGNPDVNPGTPSSPSTSNLQVASALRTEWHEEGSVDGFYDLLNDEIGFVPTSSGGTGPISNESLRAPSSANPTAINQTAFTSTGSKFGFALNATTYNGSSALSQTYNPAVYNQATGVNIQGGQNRVQFSIGEYPTEALAVGGTPSPFATVGSAGYGQGNSALQSASLLTALGTAGARQQFQPVTAANESTNKIDPNTGAAYTAGPWNTAGADNITSTAFAVTAVTYTANPGTGLQRIDLGNAQWLQTTGRLQNGALFNVVARTVDTGQRVVFAANTGVDPSWAVGSNDDGNSTNSTNAALQHSIGPSLRFDGKTSGSEAETTISASRMAVGALSVPEANAANGGAPVRALDVDFNDQTDVNSADDSTNFVRANFNTIVSDGVDPVSGTVYPHYAATLISHINTVKAPNQSALSAEEAANPTLTAAQAWAALPSFDQNEGTYTGSSLDQPAIPVSGIKGDTYGDVGALLSNLVTSTGTAAGNKNLSSPSLNNPADGLFATGYLIPQLLDYTRQADGNVITPVTLSTAALAEQSQVNANYGTLFTTDYGYAANAETIGFQAYYGGSGNGLTSNGVPINGAIPITAKDSSGNAVGDGTIAPAGNYLFGNFNQNGVRDLSAVEQAVNAALSLYAVDGAKNSIFTSAGGVVNSTVIPSLVGTPGWVTTATNTKGDLIALGDFNGDGKFDGEDLYLLAIGSSLTSANSTTSLNATATTFSDVVRDPTDVLRKNTALNYINNYLNTTASAAGALFLRQTGQAILTIPGVITPSGIPAGATALNALDPITGLEQFTYDPNGINTFNPNDVNRDGVVDFNDAVLVSNNIGNSFTNLTESLAAVQQTPGTNGTLEPLNLVAVQQIDGEAAIGTGDLAQLNSGLTGSGITNWYGYSLNKTGPGTITFNRSGGAVNLYAGAGLNISSGTVQVASVYDPFTQNNSTGNPTTLADTSRSLAIVVTTGGTLQYSGGNNPSASGIQEQRLGGLNISGGSVIIDPTTHANRTVLVTGSLTNTGKLDLGNSDLIVHGGSLKNIFSQLASGYNGGQWNGSTGITSAKANSDSSHLTALGEVQSSGGSFDGVPTTTADVLVKFTYYGDTNLDGVVDGSDYSRIDSAYLSDVTHPGSVTGWVNGDFNYDGVIDGSDYTLIDNAFNSQGTTLSSALANPTVDIAAEIASTTGSSAVPEPATLGLLGIGVMPLLGRRRR